MFNDIIWLILVGIVWGVTNPFMKRGSDGITEVGEDNKKFFRQMIFLFTRWRYLLALGLNQMGSVLFYLSLSNTDISIAVPITNSVTFIFTAIVSKIIGEDQSMGNKCKIDFPTNSFLIFTN